MCSKHRDNAYGWLRFPFALLCMLARYQRIAVKCLAQTQMSDTFAEYNSSYLKQLS